jgi:hypothetical protein
MFKDGAGMQPVSIAPWVVQGKDYNLRARIKTFNGSGKSFVTLPARGGQGALTPWPWTGIKILRLWCMGNNFD